MYKSIKAERKLRKRAEELAHDRAITELTATGSPMRIDDETVRHPARLHRARRVRRRADQPARLLHLQARLHARRRVLPLALPLLRRAEPRQARPAHRPHRQAGAAHRRARQDRHVHRAAAAPRRRPHHDHDPLPPRRRTPLLRARGQRRLDPPAQGRRHRPARPDPGGRAGRRRRRARVRSTS